MKINQDTKIAVQIIEALKGHEGPIHFEIKNIVQGVSEINHDSAWCFDLEFEKFFDALPEPRLKSFIAYVHQLAMKKNGGSPYGAAAYLGVTARTVYNYLKLLK